MVGGFWGDPVRFPSINRAPYPSALVAPCQESRPEHFPGLSQCLNDAMGVRQHYVELASMAESLCKPKGGRKSQKARSGPSTGLQPMLLRVLKSFTPNLHDLALVL